MTRAKAIAVLTLFALVVAACTTDAPPDERSDVDLGLPGRPGIGRDESGAEIVVVPGEAPGVLEVSVRWPPGAAEMQIGTDPTFVSPSWQPVQREVEVAIRDEGYVVVHARFRPPDGEPTSPVVAGVFVDTTWDRAVASGDGSPHQATSVGIVAPEVLMVRVETGRVVRGGPEHDDRVVGRPLDVKGLDSASRYTVKAADDPSYRAGVRPDAVTRTTRPTAIATLPDGDVTTVAHDLFLHLPRALRPGVEYTVTFPHDRVDPVRFTFDPRSSRSAAVHANQLGFRPGDPLKVAYVSAYGGSGQAITWPGSMPFEVVDVDTGRVVLTGASNQRSAPADGEMWRGDLTGSEVHELDFSDLDEPGRYRVCVAVIGCSHDFDISETGTWRDAAVAVARAMYHQRSGIGLGPPHTPVVRPRPFHPDDGVVARQSGVTLMENANGLGDGDPFEGLVAAATEEMVPEAWGGHFDAGDWDRRIQHLWYLRTALELVDLHPDAFASLDLNIPESDNGIPDLIDEGLWSLDLYLRLQLPNGAIRGGVESDAYPPGGVSSWEQAQDLFVYAPDPWSSFIYAGVAADAAHVLERYAPERAATYRRSAVAAMEWALDQAVAAPFADELVTQRAVAAASLYRLTGDDRWQRIFIADTPFARGPQSPLACHARGLCDAAWYYARSTHENIRRDVQANVVESFRWNADMVADAQDTTLYGWAIEHPGVPLVWGLGPSVPKTLGLQRAHALTADTRYCSAALRAATFSLGANPLGTVFLTGLGRTNVRHPLIIDTIAGGIPVWPGTPVYGLHEFNRSETDDSWVEKYFLRPAGARPDGNATPYLMSWYDLANVPPMNEYTVFQSHASALHAFGSLAATTC